jgi:adenylate kinase family enzyme
MTEVGVKRIALTGASGNGKTTLAGELAGSMSLPFLHLDGASPAQASDLIASDRWVTDATHTRALGDLVLARTQMLAWLDLPLALILWRALRRDGRIPVATVRAHVSNRRSVPARAARYPDVRLVRLRSRREVTKFLARKRSGPLPP